MTDEKTSNVLEELFLHEKPVKILISLKTSKDSIYATILSRETNCTYSHAIKILNVLNKNGLVTFEKVGRIKKVKLTKDGWDIAQNLETLMRKFESVEEKATKKQKKKK